jgi:molecular chaperone GrpE (heat shock protein)
MLEEKQKKEEEMLFVQGNYDSLQQEVDSMREIMGKLRDKYKKADAEIKDMQREHQGEKEDLLDIIR